MSLLNYCPQKENMVMAWSNNLYSIDSNLLWRKGFALGSSEGKRVTKPNMTEDTESLRETVTWHILHITLNEIIH